MIGHVHLCRACGERGIGEARACPACGGATQVAGPLWTGPLVDGDVADTMLARVGEATMARPAESGALLATLAQEARAPPLFFDIHKVGERERMGSAPTAAVLDGLHALGFRTWPVHFNGLAFRTDARAADVARVARAVTL